MDKRPLDEQALALLFTEARSYPSWQDRPVSEAQLRELYELLKWGPTSMNSLPARFVFVRSPQAKARLLPVVSPGNVPKVEQAPVTVIVAFDTRFYEWLPQLSPHMPRASEAFAQDPERAAVTAFRNGTLQGAYLILAARALGLDVGPMSGFDNARLDAEFFPDGRLRSNFLANIGYGDPAVLHPRAPRLGFEQAAELL